MQRPPNVLIVVTDDQRNDGTMAMMPATKRLFARQGRSYPNAFATTPLCCPSRASIFTGRYVHNHGVLLSTARHVRLLDQETTIQARLKTAGYRTGMFGKYLNEWDLARDPPHFDEWAIFGRSDPDGYAGGKWNVDGSLETVEQYSTTYLARRADAFLETATGDKRPWLLFISTTAPHDPSIPHSRDETAPVPRWKGNPATREEDLTDKAPFVQKCARPETRKRLCGYANKLPRERAAQLRTLIAVDEMIDSIFGKLERLGEADDTLAFFLSDNGYMWGEHSLRQKMWPYSQSVDIPFFMRWPARVRGGTIDRRMVSTLDITPTVLDAAGTPNESRMVDGRSLLDGNWRRVAILTEFWGSYGRPSWAAINAPGFRFIEYYGNDDRTVTFREYYDLRVDPWELKNLLGDREPANDPKVEDLSEKLRLLRRCAGTRCP
jgi:arylsulfatase A-like enzyme